MASGAGRMATGPRDYQREVPQDHPREVEVRQELIQPLR